MVYTRFWWRSVAKVSTAPLFLVSLNISSLSLSHPHSLVSLSIRMEIYLSNYQIQSNTKTQANGTTGDKRFMSQELHMNEYYQSINIRVVTFYIDYILICRYHSRMRLA